MSSYIISIIILTEGQIVIFQFSFDDKWVILYLSLCLILVSDCLVNEK